MVITHSRRRRLRLAAALVLLIARGAAADETTPPAADDSAELAQQLQNPVAKLISVPFQSNFDFNVGPANATRYLLNIQPVIPFSLTEDLNLITRTIMPVVHQESPTEGGGTHSGVGDILQSFFFSPAKPVWRGWIVGLGPALLYPSASDDTLGQEQWALGPTAVLLRQVGGWTYGILTNHVWSFAGADDRAHVDQTFLQPFGSYTNRMHTSFVLNTESTYDWTNSDWTVPVNALVSQLVKVSGVPLSFGFGARYYATAPDGGPDWGLRLLVTFLFPR
jgi:hypothetical protein